MHATLVAAGPSFRSGMNSSTPTGNVDIAPTVLHILGISPPKKLDGRILTEALKDGTPPSQILAPRTLETSVTNANSVWRQYLKVSEVQGVHYFDEGNGASETR
jgi:arylsulfatase A-like enzyme